MRRNIKQFFKRTIFYSILEESREYRYFPMAWKRGSFAQKGEDCFVLQYFGSRVGTYIDVGANHPFVISNTYLLYRHGWKGLTVEPLPHLAKKHAFWRPRDSCINVGVDERPGRLRLYQFAPSGLSTFDEKQAEHLVKNGGTMVRRLDVEVSTLAEIYDRHARSLQPVDLLCIDTEGMDLRVLRGNDFGKLRPKLILCEAPVTSSSRAHLQDMLASFGYRPLKTIGYNIFFEQTKD